MHCCTTKVVQAVDQIHVHSVCVLWDAVGPIPTIEELEAEEADNQDAGFKDDGAAQTGMSATPAQFAQNSSAWF